MLVCQHRNARSVRERKVQRPLLILAPLFFMINSPVTGVVITQVPVPVTTIVVAPLCKLLLNWMLEKLIDQHSQCLRYVV